MESDSCTWVPVLVVACVCCCVCCRSRIVVRSFSGGVPVAGSVGLSVSNFSMTTSLSLVPDESSVTCDSVRPEESLSRFCVTLASVLSVISVLMDDDTLRLAEQPRRLKIRVNSIIFFIFIALLRRIRHNKNARTFRPGIKKAVTHWLPPIPLLKCYFLDRSTTLKGNTISGLFFTAGSSNLSKFCIGGSWATTFCKNGNALVSRSLKYFAAFSLNQTLWK